MKKMSLDHKKKTYMKNLNGRNESQHVKQVMNNTCKTRKSTKHLCLEDLALDTKWWQPNELQSPWMDGKHMEWSWNFGSLWLRG